MVDHWHVSTPARAGHHPSSWYRFEGSGLLATCSSSIVAVAAAEAAAAVLVVVVEVVVVVVVAVATTTTTEWRLDLCLHEQVRVA